MDAVVVVLTGSCVVFGETGRKSGGKMNDILLVFQSFHLLLSSLLYNFLEYFFFSRSFKINVEVMNHYEQISSQSHQISKIVNLSFYFLSHNYNVVFHHFKFLSHNSKVVFYRLVIIMIYQSMIFLLL